MSTTKAVSGFRERDQQFWLDDVTMFMDKFSSEDPVYDVAGLIIMTRILHLRSSKDSLKKVMLWKKFLDQMSDEVDQNVVGSSNVLNYLEAEMSKVRNESNLSCLSHTVETRWKSNIKQALGSFKDGDGDGDTQFQ
ncbi:hypothetical protein Tco_1475724 [Tanacetum coccineum]